MIKKFYFKLPKDSQTVECLKNILLRFHLAEFPAMFETEEIINQINKLNTITNYSDNGVYKTTIQGINFEYTIGRSSILEAVDKLSEEDYIKNKKFIDEMYGSM